MPVGQLFIDALHHDAFPGPARLEIVDLQADLWIFARFLLHLQPKKKKKKKKKKPLLLASGTPSSPGKKPRHCPSERRPLPGRLPADSRPRLPSNFDAGPSPSRNGTAMPVISRVDKGIWGWGYPSVRANRWALPGRLRACGTLYSPQEPEHRLRVMNFSLNARTRRRLRKEFGLFRGGADEGTRTPTPFGTGT